MPTVLLHHPTRDESLRVRAAVADQWIDDGWRPDDGHPCPQCPKSAKTAGGLKSHIRAKHDDTDPADGGDHQEE